MIRYMYTFLAGMCVALEHRAGHDSYSAVFDKDPADGGQIIDVSQHLFEQGSVLGLPLPHFKKIFPQVSYGVLDPGVYGDGYEALAGRCFNLSPQVEVELCNRVFFSVGSNQDPRKLFVQLGRSLVPEWGHTLLAVVAPSKLLAKVGLSYLLQRAGKDATSYNRAQTTRRNRAPSTIAREASVNMANRAYGRSTNVTLQLSPVSGAAGTVGARPSNARALHHFEVHDLPGGSLYILENGEQFIAELPLSFLWPLGNRECERLQSLGFETIGQVAQVPLARLRQQLGPVAHAVHNYARGLDWEGLKPNFPVLYYEQTQRFSPDSGVSVADAGSLASIINELVAEIEQSLSRDSRSCGTLTLDITLQNGENWCRTRRFAGGERGASEHPQGFVRGLGAPALSLLQQFLQEQADSDRQHAPELRAVQLRAGDLQMLIPHQLSIEELQRTGKLDQQAATRQLDALLAALKIRFPNTTLYRGAETRLPRRERMLMLFDPYRRVSSGGTPECHDS